MTASNDRTAEALRIIQRTADRQGNVTMLRLAENIAHDAALVRMAQADGWDNAAQEAEDCGLLNDVFADEMRGRNPYRGTTARDEAGGRCVVCSRSAPHHGGLCCFHKYDEQPTCDLCAVDEDPDCHHEWLDRPESDTRECLICGTEVAG